MHWLVIFQIMIFKYLSQEFCGDLLKLVKQNDVYPYEHMDSFEKVFKDKFTDRCRYFSSLNGKCISENDYSNATDVWNTFERLKGIQWVTTMIFI